MSFTKDEYNRRIRAYLQAFQKFAKWLETDPENPNNKILIETIGELAWGRFEAEGGPSEQGVKNRATAYGFLWGKARMTVSLCNAIESYSARSVFLDAVDRAMKIRATDTNVQPSEPTS